MVHTALLVRTANTISGTQAFLENKGIRVIPAPVISISGSFPEPAQLQVCLASCDIICCLSQNAAQQLRYYQGQLPQRSVADTELLSQQQVWTIGNGTKRVMQSYFDNIQCPELETSEGLCQELAKYIKPGIKVGLLKGAGGRDYLTRTLSRAGAIITPINLYKRVVHQKALQKVSELLAFQQPSVIMVGSGELLQAIIPVLPDNAAQCPLIVPGARVSELAKIQGFSHVIEAGGASGDAFYRALAHLA